VTNIESSDRLHQRDMNYLAHIFLARPTVESVCGNLLGDFMQGVRLQDFPRQIQNGVLNHRLVDRFTDAHADVKSLKNLLSAERRRFSGIIADVVFDHLLIRHWDAYSKHDLGRFIEQSHRRITAGQAHMPAEMQRVTGLMIEQGWLESYASLDGVGAILNRMSRRIRFENRLHGAIDEIAQQIDAYDVAFQRVFPELIEHVREHNLEENGRG
jgi:acyl carrier protein phosphodiesterase